MKVPAEKKDMNMEIPANSHGVCPPPLTYERRFLPNLEKTRLVARTTVDTARITSKSIALIILSITKINNKEVNDIDELIMNIEENIKDNKVDITYARERRRLLLTRKRLLNNK